MKYLKLVLLLALVFVAGLCVGVVGTRVAVRNFIRQAIVNPDFLRQTSERDLTRKLKLDAAQQIQVRKILGQAQNDIKGLRDEFLPKLGTMLTKTNTDIAAVLTAEQRNKFEQIQAENKAFWSPR